MRTSRPRLRQARHAAHSLARNCAPSRQRCWLRFAGLVMLGGDGTDRQNFWGSCNHDLPELPAADGRRTKAPAPRWHKCHRPSKVFEPLARTSSSTSRKISLTGHIYLFVGPKGPGPLSRPLKRAGAFEKAFDRALLIARALAVRHVSVRTIPTLKRLYWLFSWGRRFPPREAPFAHTLA